MVMETIQIRLTEEQIEVLQSLVSSGIYPSKSEAVRDAVRKYIRAYETGIQENIETAQKQVETEIVKVIEEERKEYQKVKGTIDFYPEEKAMRDLLFSSLRNTAKKFNFKEIETPAFETLELLTAKSGEEIKAQIFTLEKRSTEQLGLRFDFTVPAARMFVQKQKELPKPVKWFVIDKAWRYEAPQKGRLREFYQFSCELLGSDKPEADAEVIRMAIELYKSMGLTEKDFYVRLNNRKLLVSLLSNIPQEKINSVLRVVDKVEKLSEKEFSDELKQLSLNEKQIKNIQNITLLKGKPSEIIQKISLESEATKTAVDEMTKIIDGLDGYEDFITLDLSLVRGQDYYTGTVFEFFDREEKYRAIGGGGRYDNLIELFKGEPCPATGFGIGLVPTMLLLEEKGLMPKLELRPDYYVAYFPNVKKEALELVKKLRKNNIVETDLMQRKFGKQMEYANSIKAKKLIVIGENEVKERNIKIKDMNTGIETEKKWNEVQ
ncbi:histidine--tRNA ligase [Candidatus Woesearchaeota archaeon]|nr:histidine--tRNA ligase [Candidatus Woesearchaeota archaeon]